MWIEKIWKFTISLIYNIKPFLIFVSDPVDPIALKDIIFEHPNLFTISQYPQPRTRTTWPKQWLTEHARKFPLFSSAWCKQCAILPPQISYDTSEAKYDKTRSFISQHTHTRPLSLFSLFRLLPTQQHSSVSLWHDFKVFGLVFSFLRSSALKNYFLFNH